MRTSSRLSSPPRHAHPLSLQAFDELGLAKEAEGEAACCRATLEAAFAADPNAAVVLADLTRVAKAAGGPGSVSVILLMRVNSAPRILRCLTSSPSSASICAFTPRRARPSLRRSASRPTIPITTSAWAWSFPSLRIPRSHSHSLRVFTSFALTIRKATSLWAQPNFRAKDYEMR